MAFALWYMSMDLTPLVFGGNDYSWHQREWVSVMFGFAMLLASYLVDLRGKVGEDNLGLIALSVLLRQRAFIVFGSLGVMGYLGHLAYSVFEDSLLFPFVLTLIGLLVIYLGVMYQRHHSLIEKFVRENLPDSVQQMVPARARAAS